MEQANNRTDEQWNRRTMEIEQENRRGIIGHLTK